MLLCSDCEDTGSSLEPLSTQLPLLADWNKDTLLLTTKWAGPWTRLPQLTFVPATPSPGLEANQVPLSLIGKALGFRRSMEDRPPPASTIYRL